MKCEDCKFWHRLRKSSDQRKWSKIEGFCRRYPKHENKYGAEWCGEFKPKEAIGELASLVPNKYKERAEEIIEIIRRHKKSPWQIVKELRKLGIIAKTTYWRDVLFYKPIIEKLTESEENHE